MSHLSKKYPRTPHLPWSPGGTNDDKRLGSAKHFLNVPIVITEKMDGSNVTMTKDAIFARSHSGPPTHESFNLAKAIHAEIKTRIPENISVFGEYLFALHSIAYKELDGYFLIFGVREDNTGKWWSWELVEEMAKELGQPTVPVLYKSSTLEAAGKIYWSGLFETEEQLKSEGNLGYLFQNKGRWENDISEGYVVRLLGEFSDFENSVAKYVRKNHVRTSEHWTQQAVVKNELKIK